MRFEPRKPGSPSANRSRGKARAKLAKPSPRLHSKHPRKSVPSSSSRGQDENFRALVEFTSDWVWAVDKDGRYTYSSPKIRELLGYKPEEIIGKTPFDFMAPHEAERVGAIFRDLCKSHQPIIRMENRNLHRDGHEVVLETSGQPILDRQGRFAGFRGIDRDVTDRKKIEEMLFFVAQRGWTELGNHFFSSLVQVLARLASADHAYVARLTHGNQFAETVAVNSKGSAASNFRYSLENTPCENVVGKQLASYPDGVQALFPKDQLLKTWNASAYVGVPLWNSKGEPLGLISLVYESRLTSPSLASSLLQIVAIRAAGELERDEVVAALRESETKFRTLARSAPVGIFLASPGGECDFVNERWGTITGLAPEAAQGSGWLRAIHPDDRARVWQEWKQVLREGREVSSEFRCQTPSGQVTWVRIAVIPQQDEFGGITRFIGIMVDVTEQHTAREQLQNYAAELEQRVDERTAKLQETIAELEAYSYSISHDMRAPLRAMHGFSDILLSEYGEKLDADGRGMLEQILSASKRMDELIQDVLAYSRLAQSELQLKPVDLDQLLQDIIHQYPDFRPPSAEIIIQSPLPAVAANEAALAVCVSNLLDNARKFVVPGVQPRILVRAEEIDGQVRLWVEDNGIGIQPDQLQRIWGIFERLHHPHEYAGTGIGLSIVRKAIERMGGKCGVESEPGKGSRFWFQLTKAERQP